MSFALDSYFFDFDVNVFSRSKSGYNHFRIIFRIILYYKFRNNVRNRENGPEREGWRENTLVNNYQTIASNIVAGDSSAKRMMYGYVKQNSKYTSVLKVYNLYCYLF